MQSKKVFFTEAAYIVGLVVLAVGAAFMQKADLGMSMVVAPAYIIHLKISQFIPFFSFGFSEICFQAVILLLLVVVIRKIRPIFLFSFVTAAVYGGILDLAVMLVGLIPAVPGFVRYVFFVVGMLLSSLGVALLFHTYIAPEAYELFVKEVSAKFNKKLGNVKTVYDISSCMLAVVMSFCFFGFGTLKGVNVGTFICALLNGTVIGFFDNILSKIFHFKDKFKFRKYF